MTVQRRTTPRADCADGVMSWIEAGSPELPALVLLHGIGSDGQAWIEQIERHASRMHVIAWNAPGYARSTPLSAAMHPGDPDVWAALLYEGLNALGIGPCTLLGHSLGAITAARFAITWPDRVKTLILSSPARGYALRPGEPLLPELRARIDDIEALGPAGLAMLRAPRTLAPGATPQMHEAAQSSMARVSPAGYRDAVHLLACGRLASDLDQWTGSLHLLGADEDRIVPLEAVVELATHAPPARLHIIRNAGHASYLQAPDQFSSILDNILSEQAGIKP